MVPEGNVINKILCFFNFAFSESPNTLSLFFGFGFLFFCFLVYFFFSPVNAPDLQVCSQLLQSCPTLCKPMDYSQPVSSAHGGCPGKKTGMDCHFLFKLIFPTQGLNPKNNLNLAYFDIFQGPVIYVISYLYDLIKFF